MRIPTTVLASLGLVAGLIVPLVVSAPPAAADTVNWAELTQASPPPQLVDPSMAWDSATNQMVLVGATASDTTEETWVLDGSSVTWQRVSSATTPPARSQAGLAFDASIGSSGELFLFGGETSGGALADTWAWDGTTWTVITGACAPFGCPSARYGASMVYDPNSDNILLYGGTDGTSSFYDTWMFDGINWFNVTPNSLSFGYPGYNYSDSPFGRYDAAMAYDPDISAVVLRSGLGALDDNYSWDGNTSTWSDLFVSSDPGQQAASAMAFDAATDQMILFGGAYVSGGSEGSPLSTTFVWDFGGATISPLSPAPAQSPSGRLLPAMAYDPDNDLLVLFGGNNGNGDNYDDTWAYGHQSDFPATVTAALTAAQPTVAGVETVPASSVRAAGVAGSSSGSSDATSAPLSSIPLSSIGLASSPLSSIPLSSIPLSSIPLSSISPATAPSGLADASNALSSTLLSDLSITYPPECGTASGATCTGWEGVLAGTSYEGIPLESVTLADVLTSSAVNNLDGAGVDLGALDLAASPLSSIPLSSIELAGVPLSSIDLGGAASGEAALTSWCNALLGVGWTCADFGISAGSGSTSVTLLSLALAGVPLSSIPLSSIPLSSIPLSSIPLSSIPLSSINLASNPLSSIPLSSIPLSSIPLSSIPLSSIPLSSIGLFVDCSNLASLCSNSDVTLAEAESEGALLPTATIGDLPSSLLSGTTLSELLTGDNTSAPGYPALTLGDLVLSTVPPATYQWQSLSLSSLPFGTNESNGGTGGVVTYTAAIDVANTPADVQIDVTLPANLAYVPGSSAIGGNPVGDPSGDRSLIWAMGDLTPGSYSLTFQAAAGTGLGPATATLSAVVSGAVVATSSASVDVVDGEEPQVDSFGSAPALAAGALNTTPTTQGNLTIGYLTSPGDLNDWTVNVPQGAELSLALSDLPSTYDLELFGPSAPQLQGTPSQNLPGVSDTLPSLDAGATTEATPGSDDIPVTPPAGDQLYALSNNPDGQSQYIQTAPLSAGTYVVQVSGYNGAYSSDPYLLQANILGGTTAPTCPNGISYLSSLAGETAATGPVAIPNGVNTLFLVDTQRLSAAFPSQATQIMQDLQSVANDSGADVVGAVIPVDAYAGVQSAYATWNSDPCSVSAANAVVAAISAVLDQIRENHPTVQNLVIVGADDQIPFARISDGASQSNERDYGASTFAGENNPEGDPLSLGYYLSDDPYASDNPLGVGSATLYDPQLGVGRLVESGTEIDSALTRFLHSNGDLDANSSLTTGYSFLTSGAEAVSANLAADSLTPSDLINESWTTSDLDTALTTGSPAVDSINAHFDYSRALPAYDNTNGTETDLFSTTDVRNAISSFAGRLLFSMGCHSGLEIDDAEVQSGATIDDWAKAFADAGALWVANTGYGYADTDTIAYSAKLMTLFAGNLNGQFTIGEAMSEAKQQYAAGNAILSPYDLKALMESTLYGLPMYHLNSPGTPAPAPSGPATVTSSGITGVSAAQVPLSLSIGAGAGQLGLVSTSNGSYYQVNSSGSAPAGTQVTEYRPIEPLASAPVTEPSLAAHGALITQLTSVDTPSFTPAYSMPAVGSADSTPSDIGDAAFPGTLQRVSTYGTFTAGGTGQANQLDMIAGQFIPDPAKPGLGTQRLFTSMQTQVLYVSPSSALADDYTPATIDSTQEVASGSDLDFDVHVTPSSVEDSVAKVLVLYTDAAIPGTWYPLTLSSSNSLDWSGSAAGTPSGQAIYMVEAVDSAGNVAVSNNEATDFTATTPPPISIALSGAPVSNGYYTGPVTATITAPDGSMYVLDGSAPAPVPSGGVTISGDGYHIITVNDPAGQSASQALSISSDQTTTLVSSDANPAVVGQAVEYTATVSPSGSTASSPTGLVEFLDGTSPIAACGGASGEPLNGGQASCGATAYASTGTHEITAVYLGGGSFAGSATSVPLAEVVGQDAAETALQSSANPSIAGQEVTFTATVTAASPGQATPTGFVEFLDDGTPISMCGGASGQLLSQSVTSCSVTYTATANHTIVAVYLGDADVAGQAESSPLTQVVGTVPTTAVVNSSIDPSTVGTPVAYTATVIPSYPGSGPISGSVEYFDGGAAISQCGGATGEPLTTGGTAVCNITYASPGFHTITAEYLGAGNYSASSMSLPITQTVNATPTTTVLKTSDAGAVVGEAVVYTAKVAPTTGGGTPTGNVEFLDGGTPISVCGAASGSTLAAGSASCTVTYASVGSHSITAEYIGLGNFAGSATSAPLVQAIAAAHTTTAVSASANPSVVGQAVTYTATVAVVSPGAGTPTGSVEFLDAGVAITACGGTSGEALNGTNATCSVTYTSPATHQITAEYIATTNFAASPASAPVNQTVGKASTTTALSASAGTALVGQTVTFTATVAAVSPGVGVPTGYVEFLDGTTPISACRSTTGEPLTSSHTATCSASFTSDGVHQISAEYLADTNFVGSTVASPTPESVDESTTTIVTSSANPSATGKAVTFTATVAVTKPATGTPTGKVEFLVNGAAASSCGGTTGEALGSAGTATCSQTFTTAGVQTVVGVYLGAGYVLTSKSPSLVQVVIPSSCVSLVGCNLAGVNLAGANLAGANLTGANLQGANLTGANLNSATAIGLNLQGATMTGVTAVGANLTGANLQKVNATGATFANANLTGANLANADLAADSLTNANLTGANFAGADLAGANITGAVTTGANFSGANTTGLIR